MGTRMGNFQRAVLGLSIAVTVAWPSQSPASDSSIGHKIAPFTLKDYRGKEYSWTSIVLGKKAIAVVFVGAECPLAKMYGSRMEKLSKDFAAKGVGFIAIDSNRQDALTDIDGFARQHGLTIPILKDLMNKVADDFGASRTPEAFVLDAQGVIRYQGRIDNQYTFGAGVGYAKPQLKRQDLAIAIDELLAGKPVTTPVTETKGCLIGRVRKPKAESTVTYSNQISRLLNQRCVFCHRPGEIGPFAMTKYEEVAGWGEMIAEVVREQRMPPWHANPHYGKFANENVLSDKDKQLIYSWVAAGCPEGNPAELPPPPKFTSGWLLERSPDKVVYMADKPVDIKAEGVEPYRYYVADPGLKQATWVRSAQCLPGNPSVVHHIIVFVAPPEIADRMIQAQQRAGARPISARGNGRQVATGQRGSEQPKATGAATKKDSAPARRGDEGDPSRMEMLCGFAPGTRPFRAPAGMAKLIPAGWKFVFQMHYTPNGSPQKDRTAIGLLFEDSAKVTQRLSTTNTMNAAFEIPAYADDYKVEARKTFVRDTLLISMFPHMHIRGKSFRYELTFPGGKKEILLDVPRYDFNWQNGFVLQKPLLIPAGSKMLCTAHFDNSEKSPFNPDPTKPVHWGDQTWDEMMIGWHDVAFPKEEAEKSLGIQRETDQNKRRKATKPNSEQTDRRPQQQNVATINPRG